MWLHSLLCWFGLHSHLDLNGFGYHIVCRHCRRIWFRQFIGGAWLLLSNRAD
jgi:hypothetical protein